ncbi:Ig-like domain-containing protein [Catenulispora sp. GP43]|uniref:Ig-like domain-containing protein n=1 Tax=Catenulispora sp. GP43 TaxID=3156263 RepID=UPI0035183346
MDKFRRRLSGALIAGSVAATMSAALIAGPAHADGAPACTDTSAKGGAISPCMMLARADNWIANGVPYDQGGWYASPSGDGTYREDCAGFVAMAWHMTWSPPVSYAPPGLDDPSISKYLGTVSSLKAAGQLATIQPGDALVLTGEHIVLFAGWTDSSHTAAVIDSESHTGVPTSQASGHDAWDTDYLINKGYKVYRYNNDQLNNPASPPTTTVTGTTVTSSAVTLTGTASPAADSFYYHVQQNGADKLVSPAVPGTPGTTTHTWQFDPKLLPNGTYQVVATATLNGVIGSSAPSPITINNGPVAPAAPTVAVPSGPLFGTIALTASAPGASSVTYKLDGTVIGTSTSGPDFSLEWDTATATRGAHSLTAVANNSGGASPASSPLSITVSSHSNPSLAALPNGGFQTAWHGADTQNPAGSLWFASGTGTAIAGNPADPDVLGVAPGTSPSVITEPDGSWVTAWHAPDTDNPTGSLWIATGTGTTVTSIAEPDKLSVATDTSPALTALPGGGWEVAWHGADTQNPSGSLWLAAGSGTVIAGNPADPDVLGMAPGTSPALTTLSDGSWETAWHGAADTGPGSLWLANGTGTTINGNPADPDVLGVAEGTSPALTALAGGSWEVAWHGADSQNPSGSLWLANGTGTVINGNPADPDVLGMAPGTNPAIAALTDGTWQVAWHGAATSGPGSLWLADGTGTTINGNPADPDVLGVAAGTSPSLIALPGAQWEVAWVGADTNDSLWLATGTGTVISGSPADPDVLGVA